MSKSNFPKTVRRSLKLPAWPIRMEAALESLQAQGIKCNTMVKEDRKYTTVGIIAAYPVPKEQAEFEGQHVDVFMPFRRKVKSTSKYMPHQGTQECARRAAR